MKPREFWVSEHGGGASIDWDGPPKYTPDYFHAGHKVYHVREVVLIDWGKVWSELSIWDKQTYLMHTNLASELRDKLQQLVEKQLAGEE